MTSAPASPTIATLPTKSNDRADRTRELLLQVQKCTEEADRARLHEEIVQINMPLARTLASRYVGKGIATDDLHQVAFLGLVKAVRGFDPGFDREFLNYAAPTIRGEIRRHFRDAGWMVRPPRRLQELQARLWAAEAKLTQDLHRAPTTKELAAELEVDPSEVVEAVATEGCFAPSSLDAVFDAGEGNSLADRLGQEDEEFGHFEARQVLGAAVKKLAERDRLIVELRFFEGLSQQEIGQKVGVSQMQVSRLLTRILGDLKITISGEAA